MEVNIKYRDKIIEIKKNKCMFIIVPESFFKSPQKLNRLQY